MKLTQKQERFATNLLQDISQREAFLQAGYSTRNRSPSAIDVDASRLANSPKILLRLAELRKEASKALVANFEERQRILTEISRGNLLDYQEVGADGGYLSIGKESPNTRAISEITSRTEYTADGAGAAVVTKVKLHNPVQAIAELNKMDKVYSEAPVYNDIKIMVVYGNKRDNSHIEGASSEATGIYLQPSEKKDS